MRFVVLFLTFALASAISFADEGISERKLHSKVKQPEKAIREEHALEREIVFADQETSFDVFGNFSRANSNGHYKDGFGGGIGLNHFFERHVGLGLETYWWEGDKDSAPESHEVVSTVSGSAILRWPMDSWNLALYGFGGGGWHFSNIDQSSFHAGAGLEYRFWRQLGVFMDGRYVFADKTNDYKLVRLGVRFVF